MIENMMLVAPDQDDGVIQASSSEFQTTTATTTPTQLSEPPAHRDGDVIEEDQPEEVFEGQGDQDVEESHKHEEQKNQQPPLPPPQQQQQHLLALSNTSLIVRSISVKSESSAAPSSVLKTLPSALLYTLINALLNSHQVLCFDE